MVVGEVRRALLLISRGTSLPSVKLQMMDAGHIGPFSTASAASSGVLGQCLQRLMGITDPNIVKALYMVGAW